MLSCACACDRDDRGDREEDWGLERKGRTDGRTDGGGLRSGKEGETQSDEERAGNSWRN